MTGSIMNMMSALSGPVDWILHYIKTYLFDPVGGCHITESAHPRRTPVCSSSWHHDLWLPLSVCHDMACSPAAIRGGGGGGVFMLVHSFQSSVLFHIHHHHHHHWTVVVVSHGWAKASACCLQVRSCSSSILSRSSFHCLAGIPCCLFLSWAPSWDTQGPSVIFEAVDMPCPGPFPFSYMADYIYDFCPLADPDLGLSILVFHNYSVITKNNSFV